MQSILTTMLNKIKEAYFKRLSEIKHKHRKGYKICDSDIQLAKMLKHKKFSELNEWELAWLRSIGILNGYWPSGNPFLNWLLARITPRFSIANAEHHDWNFFRGGDISDFNDANIEFYFAILKDSLTIESRFKRYIYLKISLIYYISVDLFWLKYFNLEIGK